MSPVPVDPFPNFVNGTIADADQVDARFLELYRALNPAAVGIDDSMVKPAGLSDVSLASPANPPWRTIHAVDGLICSAIGSGVKQWFTGNTMQPSGATVSTTSPHGLWVPPSVADVAVAGKTTRLRTRWIYALNNTGAGANISCELYPVVAWQGASSAIGPSLGTSIATAALNGPLANAAGQVVSPSFDLTGVSVQSYMPGLIANVAMAAACVMLFTMLIEMRHT